MGLMTIPYCRETIGSLDPSTYDVFFWRNFANLLHLYPPRKFQQGGDGPHRADREKWELFHGAPINGFIKKKKNGCVTGIISPYL